VRYGEFQVDDGAGEEFGSSSTREVTRFRDKISEICTVTNLSHRSCNFTRERMREEGTTYPRDRQ